MRYIDTHAAEDGKNTMVTMDIETENAPLVQDYLLTELGKLADDGHVTVVEDWWDSFCGRQPPGNYEKLTRVTSYTVVTRQDPETIWSVTDDIVDEFMKAYAV